MTISIIIFLGLTPVLLFAFLSFDKLVKLEYTKYKEAWLNDGKPYGFFWKPRESTFFESSIAMQGLCFIWLFKTPEWARNDIEARNAIKKLRLFSIIWDIGIIVWFVLMFTIPLK